jgi:thiamine biosynthesis lipoprotein
VTETLVHTFAVMGTVVSFRVVGPRALPDRDAWAAVQRAEGWFQRTEATCSRFEPASELSRLCRAPGAPVAVSPLLYHVVAYALRVADASGGAFDPTVGRRMQALGFDRNWRSGERVDSGAEPPAAVSFRDVRLSAADSSIELGRPLLLDLGAVAKGFAVDMAVQELLPLGSFIVDAGGDLYLRGSNESGLPWLVGVRHPRDEREIIETLAVTDTAVCTSGDYDRVSADDVHHLLDPRTGASAEGAASVTVLAPSAMAADALATAAFVLGPSLGMELLEREGAEGLFFRRDLSRVATAGWNARHAAPAARS